MSRIVVEIEDSWTIPAFKAIKVARVFIVEDDAKRRWPAMRQKPVIQLMGADKSDESAIEQVRIWVAGGMPPVEQMKAVLTTQAPEADRVGGLMSIPGDAAHARIDALEKALERHARLLHTAVHNWALHSVVDCPELECEEYRALLSPAPEEK